MRYTFAIPLLTLAVAHIAPGEIIDRIAVSLGPQVITASDIEREIRVNAFLASAEPDFSAAARRKTAERMVEQRLVRRELELSRYPTPSAGDVEPVLRDFKTAHYSLAGTYAAALTARGITDQEVRSHILWQLTLLRFIEVRFRSGVQVSDEAVAAYFEKNVKPLEEAAHPGTGIALSDYEERIRETLIEQQVDRDLENWLRNARRRTEIEYREEVFR